QKHGDRLVAAGQRDESQDREGERHREPGWPELARQETQETRRLAPDLVDRDAEIDPGLTAPDMPPEPLERARVAPVEDRLAHGGDRQVRVDEPDPREGDQARGGKPPAPEEARAGGGPDQEDESRQREAHRRMVVAERQTEDEHREEESAIGP